MLIILQVTVYFLFSTILLRFVIVTSGDQLKTNARQIHSSEDIVGAGLCETFLSVFVVKAILLKFVLVTSGDQLKTNTRQIHSSEVLLEQD